ncbi:MULTISPECIES: hypothetical protein [Pseudofrankia]|uniref:hypothetical protein n=1 Tax=Pseudofrankia TaxID=2994363 RepID=UPI000234BE90|nr:MULTISPECIES: hypothetical protein [Pseudofrankia]OHV40377.1 hypothetical protein BCD49_39710 [Pseudofrankia sp. EUN1h]
MGIVSPDTPDPQPVPHLPLDDRKRVTVRPAGLDAVEVTVRPGANRIDLIEALLWLANDLFFEEHYGDVEPVLVFRRNPTGAAAPAGTPVPARPAPTQDHHVPAPSPDEMPGPGAPRAGASVAAC